MSFQNFDFGQYMDAVARIVFGDPQAHLSRKGVESRYGRNGSLSVDLKKGVWQDHEDKEGGGVLAFLEKYQGVSGRDAIAWLRDRGFEVPDQNAPAPGSNRAAKREIVKTYDYLGPDGSLVFQVCRWEPKTFTQRRPFAEESGVWINGLGDDEYMRRGPGSNWSRYSEENYARWKCTERRHFSALTDLPIYRLPDIDEAIALGRPIVVVEGEKDADNLALAGIQATTAAGGAKKWSDYHTELLAGAHVVLIPDNDDTGRQHMQLVGHRLKGAAASVRILDVRSFWSDAPKKADVSDWAAAGNDLARLPELIEAHAAPWRPEPPKSRFSAVPWDRLDEPGVEHEYLVDNVLTRREVAILFGESKSGKSFEAIELGMAVARGTNFHGYEAVRGGVIYQAGEGGIGVKKRLRAYRDQKMQPGEKHLPFVLLPARVDLFAEEREDVETHRGTSALIAEIKAQAATFDVRLELVVIDTLATATPGANENASTDMSTVLSNCERIQRECNCAVLLVHHKPKNGTGPRGHSSIFANIENAIEIVVTERLDIESRPGQPDLARQIRRATVTKNKDGEDGHGWDFVLKQVDLGERMKRVIGADGAETWVSTGKRITSCIIAPPGDQIEKANEGETLSDQQHMAMKALERAIIDRGQEAPAALKLPRHIRRVCLYSDWRNEYANLSFIDDEDEHKQRERIKAALKRAGEKFLRAGWVGRADKFVWVTGRTVPGFPNLFDAVSADRARDPGLLPPEIEQGDIDL